MELIQPLLMIEDDNVADDADDDGDNDCLRQVTDVSSLVSLTSFKNWLPGF